MDTPISLNGLFRAPKYSKRKRKTRTRLSKHESLQFESLERRELLASDIQVYIDGSAVSDNPHLELDSSQITIEDGLATIAIEFKNASTAGESFRAFSISDGKSVPDIYFNGQEGSWSTKALVGVGSSFSVELEFDPAVSIDGAELSWLGDSVVDGIMGGIILLDYIAEPEIGVTIQGNEIESGSEHEAEEILSLDSTYKQQFSITNTGYGYLDLTSLSVSGSYLSIYSGLSSTKLAKNESATFGVELSTSTYGEKSGTITIGNNDNDEAPYTIDLKATVGYSATGDLSVDSGDLDLSVPVELEDDLCSCACPCDRGTADDFQLSFFQQSDGVVIARVSVSSSIDANDSLTLSGNLGGQSVSASIDLSETRLTDTFEFPFTLEKSKFSGSVMESYDISLTSSSGWLIGGPQNFSGRLEVGKEGFRPLSIPQLEFDSGDIVIDLGDGSALFFESDGKGGFDRPAGDFSQLSNITGGYEFVSRWNHTYQFDSSGHLTKRIQSDGRETDYTYTAYGSEKLLSSVTDDQDTISLTYIGNKLTGVANTKSDSLTMTYDTNGRVDTITRVDPDGAGPLSAPVTTIAYDTEGRIESVTEPGGLATAYTYDSTDRLASITSPDGSEVALMSAQQAALDDDPGLTTISSDQQGTIKYQYDSLGNITREIDAEGNETLYERNGDGLATRVTYADPDGEGPLESSVYEYTYDSRGNLLTETLPDASVRTWEYHSTWNKPIKYIDAESRITTWTYDSTYELLLTETIVIGNIDDGINMETDDLTTTYTYTSAPFVAGDPPLGMVETMTNAGDTVTEYEYDEDGNLTKTIYAVGTVDEAFTTSTYDAAGNMLTFTNELGDTTTLTYDNLSRITSVTHVDPDGAGPLSPTVEAYTYNAKGLKATESINGRTTTYGYDSNGRLTSVAEEDPDGAGPLSAPVTSYTYDSGGNQLTVTDPLGNVTTNTYTDGKLTSVTGEDPDDAGPLSAPVTSYTYDAMGRVLTTTDALNRVTTYQYDNLGRQIKVTLPDPDGAGSLVALESITEYDAFGRVTSQTNTDGTTISYTYDSEGNKLTETTALGTTTYEYDELNRLTKVTTEDPDDTGSLVALVTTYSYTATGQVASVTTPKGTTSYSYDNRKRRLGTTLPDPDGAGGQSAPVSSTTYDAAGKVLTETDALGNVTAYEYDALNRVIKIISPDPDGAGALTSPVTEYAYDEFGQLVSMTDPNGGVTSYDYDDLGRKTREIYADPDGAGAQTSPEVSYVYDAAGQMTSMTDELGNVTSYEYDNLGRRIKVTLPDPDGAGSATAPETTYRYDAAGQLLSVTDPLGRVTSYTYDNMGRQKTVTLPDPDGIAPAGPLAAPVTTYVYNANGQLASVIDAQSQTVSYTYNAAGLTATMTDPRGTTTYIYDALGRQVSITEPDPDGGGPLAVPSTSYTYDNEGDMVSMTTLDGATSYEYDDLGRLTKVTMPDPDAGGSEVSAWTTYTYDAVGRTLTETDRLSHSTSYEYDNLGRLIKKTDAEGGQTEYTYDSNGNRLTLTDPEENTTTWTYDALNRILTNTNELSDTRTYEYDAAGNVVENTDRNGRVTVYEYDDLQRRTAEKWMDGATVVRTLSYTYDAASQLTSASDPAATYTFAYDNLGRNTSTEHDLTALGFDVVIDETYDALGRRTSLAAKIDGTDDLINTYAYDYLNRMTQVTQGSRSGGNAVAEKRVDFAYDAEDKGQFTSITRYADLAGTELVATSNYGYDNADRITSLDHEDSSSSTLAGYTLSYDEGNRLTAFTVYGHSTEDATYSYDDTDQLTGADRSGTSDDESYTYDDNGNRTNAGYSTGGNNQLLSDGTYNYTYDDEGNRLTKTNISTGDYVEYTWDYRNRLINITTKNGSDVVTHEIDYTYDIFNRRIVKTIDADGAGSGTATEEVYIYDGLREERGAAGDHMLLRFDEADALTDRLLYGPNVDQILASEKVTGTSSAGGVQWALTDHLGTVRDVAEYAPGTDATTIANHLAYDAFGNITSETNSAVDFLFGYTGREQDEESDLQYNRARYFGTDIGRWISEDPIGFYAGDTNLTRYVKNRSTSDSDPSGLIPTMRDAVAAIMSNAPAFPDDEIYNTWQPYGDRWLGGVGGSFTERSTDRSWPNDGDPCELELAYKVRDRPFRNVMQEFRKPTGRLAELNLYTKQLSWMLARFDDLQTHADIASSMADIYSHILSYIPDIKTKIASEMAAFMSEYIAIDTISLGQARGKIAEEWRDRLQELANVASNPNNYNYEYEDRVVGITPLSPSDWRVVNRVTKRGSCHEMLEDFLSPPPEPVPDLSWDDIEDWLSDDLSGI